MDLFLKYNRTVSISKHINNNLAEVLYIHYIFLCSGGTSTGGAVCLSVVLCVCFTKLFQNRFRDFLYTPELIYDHSRTG